jgi:uncharacterized protein (UPF0333 family)
MVIHKRNGQSTLEFVLILVALTAIGMALVFYMSGSTVNVQINASQKIGGDR